MLDESSEFNMLGIDSLEDNRTADDRLIEDEDDLRQYLCETQDRLSASKTKIVLRAILYRTIALERGICEMRREIVALRDRVERLDRGD